MANAETGTKAETQAFERFRDLTQRVVAVPKAVVDRRAKAWARTHKIRRRKKRSP